jgi:outer membrane protein TolC
MQSAPIYSLKHIVTAILIYGVTGLLHYAPLAFAQALTPAQASVYEELVKAALPRDPQVLKAQAALEVWKAQRGLLWAVGSDLSLSLAGDFTQITPGYRLSLSLNLAELLRDRSPEALALESDLEQARRVLRLRVLEGYTRYLYALEAARVGSDGVEAAEASLAVVRAKARVGEATPAEVLRAGEVLSQARLSLYQRNLELAVALGNLEALTGLPSAGLRALLSRGQR